MRQDLPEPVALHSVGVTLSILDRRAGIFAAIYLAIGILIFAPFWEEIVVPVDRGHIIWLWPLAFPIWGYAKGSAVAGEAGAVLGVLLGIALIPVAILFLSRLVDRIVRR